MRTPPPPQDSAPVTRTRPRRRARQPRRPALDGRGRAHGVDDGEDGERGEGEPSRAVPGRDPRAAQVSRHDREAAVGGPGEEGERRRR